MPLGLHIVTLTFLSPTVFNRVDFRKLSEYVKGKHEQSIKEKSKHILDNRGSDTIVGQRLAEP